MNMSIARNAVCKYADTCAHAGVIGGVVAYILAWACNKGFYFMGALHEKYAHGCSNQQPDQVRITKQSSQSVELLNAVPRSGRESVDGAVI